MSQMRAKMKISSIERYEQHDGSIVENLTFQAVYKTEAYGDDGLDEDNTFARFTPSANLTMTVNNPALVGVFEVGQKFYVDFTKVSE